MKILHVISTLDPASGGTAACLYALTPAWAALGHSSEIVCLDRPGAPFLAAFPGRVHALGPARFRYGYSRRLEPWLRREAAGFDAVVVHGLWQYHGLAVRRALGAAGAPPYFVFAHGMLDPWFQHQYPLKHLKKVVYWWCAEWRVLSDAAAVCFTCEEERRLARRSFGSFDSPERVVAFGTVGAAGDPARQEAAFRMWCPRVPPGPFWLFLGRLHFKKGLDLLLAAYGALAAQPGFAGPALVIAGPCADAAYLRDLQALAARLCPAGSVHWPGMLEGDAKWGALHAAEAFLLPSHQENFGLAVAEALSCGTPVLLSDKVNIWREIEADRAGLVGADDAAGTLGLLTRWRTLPPADRAAMRAAAQACFHRRFAIDAAAASIAGAIGGCLAELRADPPRRRARPAGGSPR